MAGILYIVATPIGNLEDITLRALKVLKEADLILAEDTRVTKKLLMHYDIETPVLSYHQHSSEEKKNRIISSLVNGQNLALVTDALGFLPKKKRKKLFTWLKEGKITFAFYESPKRILKTLAVLGEYFGSGRRVFVGRELTKIHESFYRGTVEQVVNQLQQKPVKGEVVVVVEGR